MHTMRKLTAHFKPHQPPFTFIISAALYHVQNAQQLLCQNVPTAPFKPLTSSTKEGGQQVLE